MPITSVINTIFQIITKVAKSENSIKLNVFIYIEDILQA